MEPRSEQNEVPYKRVAKKARPTRLALKISAHYAASLLTRCSCSRVPTLLPSFIVEVHAVAPPCARQQHQNHYRHGSHCCRCIASSSQGPRQAFLKTSHNPSDSDNVYIFTLPDTTNIAPFYAHETCVPPSPSLLSFLFISLSSSS